MTIGAPNAGTLFTNATASNSSTVAFPATTTNGNIMTLFVTVGQGSLVTLPSGWTQIASLSNTGNTLLPSVFAAWKQANGTEGGTSLVVSHGTGKAFAQIVEWSGVDTTTPIDVAASTVDSSAGGIATCTIPGITTVTAGCTLVTVASDNSAGTHTATPPSGFTELSDGGGTAVGEIAYLQGVAAGATGSEVVTFSSTGKQVGILFALRPAAATSKTDAETGSGAGAATVSIQSTAADTGHDTEAASVSVVSMPTLPADVALDDPRKLYAVYLLDSSRTVIGQVKTWLSISVALNFNDISSYTITAPTEALGAIVAGGGLLIKRNNVPLIHGPVTQIIDQRDVGNPNGLITLAGKSDEIMLADRVCYPNPALAFGSQTSGAKDTQTGAAETIIKHYVNLNAGPGALSARQTSGLTVEADAAHGTSLTANAQFDQLLGLIQPLAATDGLGFRVALGVGSGRIFQVFVPNDLSGQVRFGLGLRNTDALTNELDAPAATREMYGGGTAAGTKAFSETADTGSESAWGRRVELYKTNADTTNTTVLAQNGAADLKVDAPTQQITFTPRDTAGTVFGVHYGMGDKLTVITSSGEVADVLRAATFDFSGAGPEAMTLTIGPLGTTSIPTTFLAIRRLVAAIRNIATRR